MMCVLRFIAQMEQLHSQATTSSAPSNWNLQQVQGVSRWTDLRCTGSGLFAVRIATILAAAEYDPARPARCRLPAVVDAMRGAMSDARVHIIEHGHVRHT